MTGGAVPRPLKRGGPLLLWALLILGAALAGSAVSVSAQQEQLLTIRQTEYDAAVTAFRAQQDRERIQQARWLAAAQDSVRVALASRDSDRIERADRRAMDESMELHRQRMQTAALRIPLLEKTRALQEALEQQANALEAQLSNASPAQRQQLTALIDGHWEQIRRIEPEAAQSPLLFFPTIVLLARDSRTDIQNKIEFLERRIQLAQADFDRVTEELDRQQRIARQQRLEGDAAANLRRFGEDPPGARAGRPPEPPRGAAAQPSAPLDPQQRIEALTAWKAELEALRHQLTVEVAKFKDRLTTMGGGLQ